MQGDLLIFHVSWDIPNNICGIGQQLLIIIIHTKYLIELFVFILDYNYIINLNFELGRIDLDESGVLILQYI